MKNLILGQNVVMEPNATISWKKITNQPTDLVYESALESYLTTGDLSSTLLNYVTNTDLATKLGEDYIITGKILANQIASGTISGVSINVDTDLKVGNNIRVYKFCQIF